ncbi:MAG: hypothetical protein JWR69_2652 [Pedosphaera sp.]|nr:hypothetical protein [Pedosphaera sp.]
MLTGSMSLNSITNGALIGLAIGRITVCPTEAAPALDGLTLMLGQPQTEDDEAAQAYEAWRCMAGQYFHSGVAWVRE